MLVYECLMIMLMLCKSSYARLTPRVLHQRAFLWPAWAQESKGWPNSLDGHPIEEWAHERQKLRRTNLKGVLIRKQVSTGLALDESL